MVSLHALPLSSADLFAKRPAAASLASRLSTLTGKAHVRFTADGRNALYDILSALNLKKTDEVLLPAYTCRVLENVVRHFCTPVFVDVDENAVMLLSDAKSKTTARTQALLLVHPYGVSADAPAFSRFCQGEDLVLIEDLAQSVEGSIAGTPLGAFGDYVFCSFRFSKDVSCLTGGAVLSHKPLPERPFSPAPSTLALRAKLSALLAVQRHAAVLAQKAFMGLTSSEKRQAFVRDASALSEFQTGLLAVQLARMPSVIAARRSNAAYLRNALPKRVLPPVRETTFYRFPIRTRHADALQRHLLAHGIAAERMYDYALAPLPGAQAAAEQTLCIPAHHRFAPDERQRVAECVNAFLEKNPEGD